MHGGQMGSPHWTAQEVGRLEWLWANEMGHPDGMRVIAREMGRPVSSITQKARRLGLRRRCYGGDYYGLGAIADLFDKAPGSVLQWAQRGHFGRLLQYGHGHTYHAIATDDLWAWMETMKSWHLWSPGTLTDACWKEHFTELRQGWIDTGVAALLLVLTRDAVTRLCKRGRLPGCVPARVAWFRVEDVLEFGRKRGDKLPFDRWPVQ
jgi:hypothetical protein